MAKLDFCIYNKLERKVVMSGTYGECLLYFNRQDKVFRKVHKIANKKDVKTRE